jgi:hypothetical protein
MSRWRYRQSDRYTDKESLHFSNIELYLKGATADFHNLRAAITIIAEENHKNANNDETVRYLRPLNNKDVHVCPIVWLLIYTHNASDIHICPLAWLTIHTLRHRLVYGQTLQEVLDRAMSRSDHLMEWVQPTYPVLSSCKSTFALDLQYPANTGQLNDTVKEIGLISNILLWV